MTSAHSPIDAARALSALRERLERAARASASEADQALALAHADPGSALAWLRAEEGSARALPADVLKPLLALLGDRLASDGTRARELAEVSARARERKLSPADMQGGCFTISSLGGIGGTAFTPIINAPEVAILGVSRAVMRPVYRNGTFEPRLMLPLSLSYDHRVIDGAVAARFIVYFSGVLADIRRILL